MAVRKPGSSGSKASSGKRSGLGALRAASVPTPFKARSAPATSTAPSAKSTSAPAKSGSLSAETKPEPEAKTEPKPTPAPNMTERMQGVQGWMAEIERRQKRMTRLGGIALAIAIAMAAGALALGVIQQRDGATQDDVDELRTQVEGLQAEVKQTTEQQLKSLNETIGSLDQRLQAQNQQQQQAAATIAALQSQLSAAQKRAAAAAAPAPAQPGAKP